MRKPILVLAALSLVACAKDKGAPQASASAQNANSASISPAAAAGIYLDKSEVATYRATRQISADACDAATERQGPAAGFLLLHKDGGVYLYDPDHATRPEDKLFQFHNGKLQPRPAPGSAPHVDATLFRTAQGVRFHLHTLDAKTHKAEDSDHEMAKVTIQEARDVRNQEYKCAAKQVTGVLTNLPVGSGEAKVTDASGNVQTITMSGANGNPVSCHLSEDGNLTEIEALRATKTAGVYAVDGIAYTVGKQIPFVTPFPMEALLGKAGGNSELFFNLASEPDSLFSGKCVTRLKVNSYRLEAQIQCAQVDRVDSATQKHDVVAITASLACDRLTVK